MFIAMLSLLLVLPILSIVDIIELSTGLGVLCGESRSDRVAAVFQLYDADGDGYLSFEVRWWKTSMTL